MFEQHRKVLGRLTYRNLFEKLPPHQHLLRLFVSISHAYFSSFFLFLLLRRIYGLVTYKITLPISLQQHIHAVLLVMFVHGTRFPYILTQFMLLTFTHPHQHYPTRPRANITQTKKKPYNNPSNKLIRKTLNYIVWNENPPMGSIKVSLTSDMKISSNCSWKTDCSWARSILVRFSSFIWVECLPFGINTHTAHTHPRNTSLYLYALPTYKRKRTDTYI